MASPVDTDYRSVLSVLHQRLHNHFTRLREARDRVAPGTPVFALEHGLSAEDLALVRAAVKEAVSHDSLPRDVWLPFVIDTAEVGYEFSGDEYWQTFASRTPGWTLLGDPARQYVRGRYRRFGDAYGGATPAGPWAEKFSIICWPITHAVLPTDLQRHLARLLYDFRHSLTADLLSDPGALGQRLAARAWQASARFEAFAQNTELLGQVAAALLAGDDDEESPFLLWTTLARIVDDLNRESEARRWLRDAKYLAQKVRTRGFQPTAAYRSSLGRQRQERAVATDPVLSMRESADGWSLYLELPDLVSLMERLPEVGEQMARLRPVVEGATRRFGGGQLLYPGQPVRVSRWPQPDRPLIQLEHGSDLTNRMLRDHCAMSSGPVWLFRLRDRGFGSEVRGKFVRPGHRYLLLSIVPLAELPNWVSMARVATEGVDGYELAVPAELDTDALGSIRQLGVGAVMDVDVRPVGVVPAGWDGEGTAEWFEGEDAVVAIGSSRSVTNCLLSLDDQPAVVSWPEDGKQLIVQLTDLTSGRHRLHVSLSSGDATVADGALEVVIRPPRMQSAAGTPREGLMFLPSPARPTLDEIWDGQASVQLLGPPRTRVSTSVAMSDLRGRPLVTRNLNLTLPVGSTRWADFFATQIRKDPQVYKSYEQAESCVISATTPELGKVTLRCDRAFKPLRWAFHRDRDGPYVSLVDNTDGVRVTVTLYEFSHPRQGSAPDLELGLRLRRPGGGLVVASAGLTHAAVILPPHVRDFADFGTRTPRLTISRELSDVVRVIEVASLWGSAALPADPVGAARRFTVLRAFAEGLVAVIAGRRWTRSEADYDGDPLRLRDAIGDAYYQRRLRTALNERQAGFERLSVPDRVSALAGLLAKHAGPAGVDGLDERLAEFLLRLATEPGTLVNWPAADRDAQISLVLQSPVLVRAARFVVLTTSTGEDTGSIYPGWVWE